jgi:hypothetical protein
MTTAPSLEFSRTARMVADAARAAGWIVPTFRSPPRLASARRTLRRRADGGLVVAIRIVDRPWPAVIGDLVEGVIVANDLDGADAQRCRDALWAAVATDEGLAA